MPRRGSRLLGRSHEMAALMALLDRAEVERADPLLMVGEAGMGKTALLDAFAGQPGAGAGAWHGRQPRRAVT